MARNVALHISHKRRIVVHPGVLIVNVAGCGQEGHSDRFDADLLRRRIVAYHRIDVKLPHRIDGRGNTDQVMFV